jgi:Xaa-Pro aminopeptidase
MGYNADITRTVVGHSKASHRQQEVYNAVKEIQQETYKLIKAGIKAKDYEHQVETLVGQQLIKLGIIKKLDHQAIKRYYPHACSHSLGIDTHDPADYNYPLPENVVMTVEPGIYIKEEGIGVRLEDVVRVTKNGCQLMTADLPTSLYIS